jgi:hypothetical protein
MDYFPSMARLILYKGSPTILKNIIIAILLIICLSALVVLAVFVMVKVDWDFRDFDPKKDVCPCVWVG